MERWKEGEMEEWRDGGMEGWRDREMERWRDRGMEGWRNQRMGGAHLLRVDEDRSEFGEIIRVAALHRGEERANLPLLLIAQRARLSVLI